MSEFSASERDRLDAVAERYDSAEDFDRFLINYCFETISRHSSGGRLLEMGCANGVMSRRLVDICDELHIVEGAKAYVNHVKGLLAGHDNVTIVHALFEEYEPEAPFDEIIMASMLEHLDDPVAILRLASGWLIPGGKIHVIVPNAESLHRRVGRAMNLIPRLDAFSDRDQMMSHRRVYNYRTLLADVEAAGLSLTAYDGVFLKPLSNAQMVGWSQDLLNAFYVVGRELPDYCSFTYFRCARGV